MKSLIKVEWLKIKGYPVFWWMIGIIALTYPGINYIFYNVYAGMQSIEGEEGGTAKALFSMLLGEPYSFPEVWHSIAYLSSFFIIFPSILVVMLINNEYTYKTNRQNIIDGWSRNEFITSKLIDVAIISLAITIIYTITTLVFGSIADIKHISQAWKQLHYIPLFFLQTFAQLTIAFLCGFFIRKSFLAIGVFFTYYFIVENIIIAFLMKHEINIYQYFPFEISDKIVPPVSFLNVFSGNKLAHYKQNIADIPLHVVLTIILTSGIWFLCYRNYNKRDL